MTRALLAAIAVLFPAISYADWSLADLNKTIEQTNFIVNRGCSGTLISLKDRLVLTNYHCIDDNVTSVEREITNQQGWVRKVKIRKYEDVPLAQNMYSGFVKTGTFTYIAEIIAESKTRDLAVLKIKGETLHTYASPILPDGEKVTRGEKIYTVGNPLGEDATVVSGIVSNVNRAFDFPWTDGARLPMIQISGGIAGGNSGGALYNDKGQLIGVPAAGYQGATHLGFAIPMDVIKPFLQENCIMTKGEVVIDESCVEEKKKKAKEKEENKD